MSVKYAAVSAMGQDRVGLVDDIVSWIGEHGGNIEESKMSVLGGEFAVIMLVGGGTAVTEKLIKASSAAALNLGISLNVVETTASRTSSGGLPYILESVSLDSPGIVHALTGEIRSLGVSIEELETSSSAAPMSGAPMFKMKAVVILPESLAVSDFREQIQKIAHLRNLDIRIEPA